MKILFLSYSDVRYDGRLRELLTVADAIGEVYSVIKHNRKNDKNNLSIKKSGITGILQFVRKTKALCKKMGHIDILFIDNRIACIPGLMIKHKLQNILTIQDVRELYLIQEQTRIRSKIGCIIEKAMIKKSDIIICANIYRAKKMMEVYSLVTCPLIYENIRELSYNDTDIKSFEKKYNAMFQTDGIKIISTSGYALNRTNDQLVREMKNIEKKVQLFIVGGGRKEDRMVINKIVKENHLKNIYFIDKVREEELKYLISKCDIGIVNYGQYDTNNRLCASGKIFEFLFEELPVVTTNNLPLKDFCREYEVGVSGDSYSESINEVIRNYDIYKKKVKEFINIYDIANNRERVIYELNERIKEGMKHKCI